MTSTTLFPAVSRLLHWLMAVMILAMLFIGVGMVTSPDWYHWLLSVHRPLGAAILVLAALRLLNRQLNPPPPLPRDMPSPMKAMAHLSHVALYALMFAVPLAGWGALSAGGYPIVLYGAIHLPPILPQGAALYTALHMAHEILALLLFATFLAHLGAALAHALVFRDGVFESMASLKAAASRQAEPGAR
ncbi:cytochrome b [Azospirillum rugosum]|uniref:Cytochrome b561 n=1 Tax=Azospirillum rugosum TaxID=416170 RepID=A0ABS4SN18_9PROT|nr:cytochrome b/b6 domain-containing protein [Azospirillum rugosum]MBP2293629.1 cytochrome b561 [Azospirillum rugosum]MDQ0527174.1 cytochrome b561 [Azospirillum rugosum]